MTHPNLAKWAKALEEIAEPFGIEFNPNDPSAVVDWHNIAAVQRDIARQALSEIKAEAEAPNPPEAGEGSAQSQPCTDAQEHSHDAPGAVEVLREFVRRADAVRNAKGSLNAIFEAHGQLVALGADARRVLDACE